MTGTEEAPFTVAVIGATGGVGSRTVDALIARGDTVRAFHRHPAQADRTRSRGAEPFLLDLTRSNATELTGLLRGADAVVFAAGAPDAGPAAADAVDGRGVILAADAATRAGVRRFLLISAFPDAWRDQRMPSDFEHYMAVKRQADVDLAGRDLDWVIVRPGTLTSAPGTGRVRLGAAIPYGSVSRDDAAAVLGELVHRPQLRRVIIELTGGDTPVRDAVDRYEASLA